MHARICVISLFSVFGSNSESRGEAGVAHSCKLQLAAQASVGDSLGIFFTQVTSMLSERKWRMQGFLQCRCK